MQHGDFSAHPSVAAPTVPRCFAADEELRGLCACNVADYFWRLVFLLKLHPSLGENLCPRSCCRNRSLGASSNDSVPEDRRCGNFCHCKS